MIRISTIFIAICMVLVAASLGLALHAVAGFSGTESAIVALTALTFLILYNAVSMRLRDRSDVGGQIADLSRGTADLARQVAEFGRRLAAVEGRVVSANSAGSDRIQAQPLERLGIQEGGPGELGQVLHPGQVAGRHQRQPGQRAVEHRHVHELALAAALALAQRGEDPECRHQRAAADVGDLPGGLDGRPVAVARLLKFRPVARLEAGIARL